MGTGLREVLGRAVRRPVLAGLLSGAGIALIASGIAPIGSGEWWRLCIGTLLLVEWARLRGAP